MPSWDSFRRKKGQSRPGRHKSALQMPSKNRSDKWDRTMKASVNPRKEKSRNPSNLGGFGMANHANLDTEAPHLASRGAFDRKERCIKAIYEKNDRFCFTSSGILLEDRTRYCRSHIPIRTPCNRWCRHRMWIGCRRIPCLFRRWRLLHRSKQRLP